MLELKDVTYTIRRDGEEVPLVNGVSICVPKGHFMAIVGPSGCGKTTLLKTIAGLNPESDGDLFWEGRNLSKERDFTPTEIGYVPQFSIAYDTLTVDESIEAATRLRVGDVDQRAGADGAPVPQVGAVLDRRLGHQAGHGDQIGGERSALGGAQRAAREAGAVEEQRAGADARHPLCAGGRTPQVLEHGRVLLLGARADAARDQQHVEGGRVCERVIGEHAQALRAADGPIRFGDRPQAPAPEEW
mgnify:CR=1 FL=1